MRTNKTERIGNLYVNAHKLGLSPSDTSTLLRIERTLHRWAEMECNGEIERNDAGQPVVPLCDWRGNRAGCRKVADREASALRRLATIMKAHPHLAAYNQTDPRGCALYVLRREDIPEGSSPHSCYHRGLAICL